MKENAAHAMVNAALTLLVSARKLDEGEAAADLPLLDEAGRRRLGVAITAAHTVIEPPSMPTDELRAMNLWQEGD